MIVNEVSILKKDILVVMEENKDFLPLVRTRKRLCGAKTNKN
jgi:hypothetical protein